MTVPFMLSDESLTVQFSSGEVKTIHARSPHFNGLVQAIKNNADESEIHKLFSLAEAVKTFSEGLVTIRGNEVLYKGQVIKNSVSDRIIRFMTQGLPWKPLAKFLENLLQNPSKRAVEYLYNFLEYEKLAISEDGCFVAYKAVRNDYKDKHSGTFSNIPGSVLEMERNGVCDDPTIGCSYGFHVGSLEYVRDFACGYGTENGDRIVIVKCNPKDVVSVPHDCNFQKVRTSRYEVLGEYTGPLPEYVCDSCQALREIDECDGEDDDGDYDGVHVTIKTFQEWYTAKSFVKNDQCNVVSKFSCDSFDSPLLEDFVRKALDANLGVQVIDQDGVDVTEDIISTM